MYMYILIKHDKDRNRDVEFFKNGKVRIKFSVFYLQEDFVVTRGFSITLNAYRQQLQVQNKLTHVKPIFFKIQKWYYFVHGSTSYVPMYCVC